MSSGSGGVPSGQERTPWSWGLERKGKKGRRELVFVEHLLCASNHVLLFTDNILFIPCNSPVPWCTGLNSIPPKFHIHPEL